MGVEDKRRVLEDCLQRMREAYPEEAYQPPLDSLRLLFSGFDLDAYQRALAEGELPQPHSGMVPSVFRDTHYFLAPGSRGRTQRILSQHLGDLVQTISPAWDSDRSLLYGIYRDQAEGNGFNVGVLTTQMGPSSVEISLGLDFLSVAPEDYTLIRVGTAGTMQPDISAPQVVISSHALRAEGVTDKYVDQDYVATASPEVVAALILAAERLDIPVRLGPKITKDSLPWEIGLTPFPDSARRAQAIATANGILCSSMESSVLYALADLDRKNLIFPASPRERVRAGSVLAIVNFPPGPDGEALFSPDREVIDQAEEKAMRIGQEAVRILYQMDHGLISLDEQVRSLDRWMRLQMPSLRRTQQRIRETYAPLQASAAPVRTVFDAETYASFLGPARLEALTPVKRAGDAALYRIGPEEANLGRFIVTTPETRELCTDALLVGEQYVRRLQEGIAHALRLLPQILDGFSESRINILNILTGGEAWRIGEVLAGLYGIQTPKKSYLWSKRSRQGDQWLTTGYHDKVRTGTHDTLFIGDIVATGVSLYHSLETVAERYEAAKGSIDRVVLFTIGGVAAEEAMAMALERLRKLNPDVKGTVVYFEGRFTVADHTEKVGDHDWLTQGTDFLLTGATMAPEYLLKDAEQLPYRLEKCRAYYGSRRFAEPNAHLEEVRDAWRAMRERAAAWLTLQQALSEKMIAPDFLEIWGIMGYANAVWPDPLLQAAPIAAASTRLTGELAHAPPTALLDLCNERIALIEGRMERV
ncbi:MAG: hypothetical protein V1735_01135 [Nanoarchaeota archaeon]